VSLGFITHQDFPAPPSAQSTQGNFACSKTVCMPFTHRMGEGGRRPDEGRNLSGGILLAFDALGINMTRSSARAFLIAGRNPAGVQKLMAN
jgi:hypothetical protein